MAMKDSGSNNDSPAPPFRGWSDKAVLARHGIAIAGVLVGVALAWSEIGHAIRTADATANRAIDRSFENKAEIDILKTVLHGLHTRQEVMINQLENDRRSQAEFRARTELALDRILEKLERQEATRTRSHGDDK